MIKRTFALLLILASFSFAQEQIDMNKRLDFFLGEWEVVGKAPGSDQELKGSISFKWTVKGSWLMMEYHDDQREVISMMRWNEQMKHYDSISFFGPTMHMSNSGTWIDEKTLRFTFEVNGAEGGMDFIPIDGGVLERDWMKDEKGEMKVLMEARYYRK